MSNYRFLIRFMNKHKLTIIQETFFRRKDTQLIRMYIKTASNFLFNSRHEIEQFLVRRVQKVTNTLLQVGCITDTRT